MIVTSTFELQVSIKAEDCMNSHSASLKQDRKHFLSERPPQPLKCRWSCQNVPTYLLFTKQYYSSVWLKFWNYLWRQGFSLSQLQGKNLRLGGMLLILAREVMDPRCPWGEGATILNWTNPRLTFFLKIPRNHKTVVLTATKIGNMTRPSL